MKNKLFSYLFLSMLSSSGLQATVYAVGTLVKGDKKVHFLSGVIDQNHVEQSQAQCIQNQANHLQAQAVYGDSIKIEYEYTYAQLKQIAVQEVQHINPAVLNKGTYNAKKQAFGALRENDDATFASFSSDKQKAVREFFDVITRNRMIDAIEKSSARHVFVCCEPIHGAVVWNRLVSEDWSKESDDSIVTFAQSFAQNYTHTAPVAQVIAACKVQPVDIAAWFASAQSVNEITVQPVAQLHRPQPFVAATESFFTARNMFACAVGVTAVAALACIAVKNDLLGWLKKKIAPSLIVWGRERKNLDAIDKGLEYFGLTS